METLYINLFGGPGCGKSVAMARIFIALKTRGFTCEMVQEHAKELVWDGQEKKLLNQYEVAEQTYDKLMARMGKTMFVVTDGPLANSLYYNLTYPHVCDVEKTQKAVLAWNSEFFNLNLYLHRGNFEYEKPGRYQTEEQAKAMDPEIFKILGQFLKLEELPANFSEELVLNLIDDRLHRIP